MSKFVRTFVVRLRGAFRLHSSRRSVRLPLSVSLADDAPRGSRREQACEGYTCDLSDTGLSFVLPTMRIGGRHVFGEGDSALRIRLELPGGPVDICASPVRYDLFGAREREQGYLIGAQIVKLSGHDQARYLEFLRTSPQRSTRPLESKHQAPPLPHPTT